MSAPTEDQATVRLLNESELVEAARVVATGMLGGVDDETSTQWASLFDTEGSHGAFDVNGSLVGLARRFPSELSVPGGSVAASCVTSVAVLPTHRRQGHLSRMMRAQLDAIAAEGVPVALLVAAEWPIYGQFGYGPAVDACAWEIDARSASFTAAPTGRIELCTPDALRPHLEAMHDRRWARTPGAVTRSTSVWDHITGVATWPNDKTAPGQRRGAIWRDEHGEVQGAVGYVVRDAWHRNRPNGTAHVTLLVGATPVAERELWRHLCDLDWIATVAAGNRPIDDPLPYFLTDGRAAVQMDHFDCIWARILDLPAALAARRSTTTDRLVLEVDDDMGYTAGRWSLALGPDHSQVDSTTDAADVRLPVGALSATYLGGTSVSRLHEAGWVEERTAGAVTRLDTVLRAPMAPWSPTTY